MNVKYCAFCAISCANIWCNEKNFVSLHRIKIKLLYLQNDRRNLKMHVKHTKRTKRAPAVKRRVANR